MKSIIVRISKGTGCITGFCNGPALSDFTMNLGLAKDWTGCCMPQLEIEINEAWKKREQLNSIDLKNTYQIMSFDLY